MKFCCLYILNKATRVSFFFKKICRKNEQKIQNKIEKASIKHVTLNTIKIIFTEFKKKILLFL